MEGMNVNWNENANECVRNSHSVESIESKIADKS